MPKTYYILDNGWYSFKVIVSKHIDIFKAIPTIKNDTYVEEYSEKPVLTIKKFEKIFVGKDNRKSNSLIIKLSAHKYIFVGWEIYSFSTKDEIIKYVSPVGNSGVVYPYAIGEDNIYLMIEYVYIDKERYDPYSVYYGHVSQHFKKLSKKILYKRNNL